VIVERIAPLTGETWPDLEELFGPDNACAGCWCMWWRTPKGHYQIGRGNSRRLRRLVDTEVSVGLLAYAADPAAGGERVAGWCAVAPRSSFPRLANTLVGRGRTDEEGRWAVPCFFVARRFRREGMTDALLAAACEHSRSLGATVVEGYPMTTTKATAPDLFVGTKSLFARHGFVVVREPTSRRALMERTLAHEA
jgi:GNAT superfamily N-acetyltransferase